MGDAVRWALAALMEEGLPASRFNDKVLLSVAEREGVPLATFDKRLRAQAKGKEQGSCLSLWIKFQHCAFGSFLTEC